MSADGFVRWTADYKHIPRPGEKKNLFPRAAILEVAAVFRFCRPVAALWNFTCVTPGSGNAHTDTWIFHCSHKVCESSAFPPRVSIRESGTALRMHLAPRIALTSAPPQIIKNSDQKALRSRAVISVLRQDRETYLQSSKRPGEWSGLDEYKIISHGLREVWNKVVLTLGCSLVDLMCSGPVMSLTDVARSLFPVQTTMAVVQVFSVRLSNRGLWASPGILFIPLACWDKPENSSGVQDWTEISAFF